MKAIYQPQTETQTYTHTHDTLMMTDLVRVGRNPLDSGQTTKRVFEKESYAMASRLTQTTWGNDPLHVWAIPSESFT